MQTVKRPKDKIDILRVILASIYTTLCSKTYEKVCPRRSDASPPRWSEGTSVRRSEESFRAPLALPFPIPPPTGPGSPTQQKRLHPAGLPGKLAVMALLRSSPTPPP